jgi:branched-chain amino acid transport system ATP-binding protein
VALALQGVEVSYAGAPALRGVTLTVPRGAAVALLGANGAGKTTTIRTIAGLLGLHSARLTAGSVTTHGQSIERLASHEIARLGIAHVPEGRLIFSGMSVEENLRIGATSRTTGGATATMERVLEMFPVLRRRLRDAGGYLSGGEQQMLAISRALMADPNVLLLDEVSLGLAPLITRSIFETLAEIRRESGTSMLVVEQNANLALEFCDYAFIIESGRVLYEGSADDLRHDPQVRDLYLGGSSGESAHTATSRRRPSRTAGWLS